MFSNWFRDMHWSLWIVGADIPTRTRKNGDGEQ